VVEVGIDEHHLDAELFHPEAAGRALERRVDAASAGLRVGRPEDHHVGMLQSVFQQIVLLGDPQPVTIAPHVRSAPVPAFPAIGVVLPIGEADQVHEAEIRAVAIADVAPQMVGPRCREDRRWADLPFYPDHFIADDVQGFVPGDGLVSGDAAVLEVAVAFGIEVHPFERSEDPFGRVDHGLLSHGVRGERGPTRGLELPPRASMVQLCASFSSRSMGVMRMIFPSCTSTKTGPPVVQFVNRWTFPMRALPPFTVLRPFAPCGTTGIRIFLPIPLYIRTLPVLALPGRRPKATRISIPSSGIRFR